MDQNTIKLCGKTVEESITEFIKFIRNTDTSEGLDLQQDDNLILQHYLKNRYTKIENTLKCWDERKNPASFVNLAAALFNEYYHSINDTLLDKVKQMQENLILLNNNFERLKVFSSTDNIDTFNTHSALISNAATTFNVISGLLVYGDIERKYYEASVSLGNNIFK
jgi:hypothetical protein